MAENPFTPLFQKGEDLPVAPYLTFLNMDADAIVGITRMELALTAENAREHRLRLFEQTNWRMHLVAAIALLMDPGTKEDFTSLWSAVDRGSWVSPQLVVTAYFADPDFPKAARARIEGRCLLVGDAWGKKDGPTYNGKSLGALLAIAGGIPALRDFVVAERGDARVLAIIESAVDNGGGLAAMWKTSLEAAFVKHGKPLVPRFTSA